MDIKAGITKKINQCKKKVVLRVGLKIKPGFGDIDVLLYLT